MQRPEVEDILEERDVKHQQQHGQRPARDPPEGLMRSAHYLEEVVLPGQVRQDEQDIGEHQRRERKRAGFVLALAHFKRQHE